jgi:esterase
MLLNSLILGPDDAPPVALLHGLFGAAPNLGAVQRELAKKCRTIALDLRNHGASPHAATMSYAEMAADVRETLQALGAWPAALIGHSMGGKVAMRLALEAAEVPRLLVLDIAPVAYPPGFRAFASAMQAVRVSEDLTRAVADRMLAPVVADAGGRAFLLQNLRYGVNPGWRIGLDAIAQALPQIEGWEAPIGARYEGFTVFAGGDRSDYIRPEFRPAIRDLFPMARFVTVKNAGHWLHADNPLATAALAGEFMAA